MKIVVCGGRDLEVTEARVKQVAEWLMERSCTEVLCGGQSGGDKIGEIAALRHDIAVRYFPADWGTFGLSAGPRRNQQMADIADVCLALPGGRGTKDMVNKMIALGKPVVMMQ